MSNRESQRAIYRVIVLSLALTALAIALVSPRLHVVHAQSPSPTFTFIDYSPYTFNDVNNGSVVEGLGSGSCAYSLSAIKSMTVNYLTDAHPVITELSPQSYCASLSSYESMISGIESYVEGHASNAGQFWGGIMLDEESAFGFSVAQLESLNTYTANVMGKTPGISWWYAQDFSGKDDWSQTDYDNIIGQSNAAPQPATAYMVGLINNSHSINLVSWSKTYPAPYNTESYDDGVINGTPYQHNFYSDCCAEYWDNQYQNP